MSIVRALFGELTAVLEDMHGVAVEGQSSAMSADEGWVLLASMREGLSRAGRLMADVALILDSHG